MNVIRVTSLSCTGDGGVGASLERAKAMIAEACHDQSDLICMPELFAWTDAGGRKTDFAEPVDGKVGSFMAGLARKHGTNILTSLIEREGARVYNSMVWFDRQGKFIGTYRKTFPTDYEMKEGICPGPLDFDAFHTEFGPIGSCICFDLNYREVIERLAEQEVRLVVFPSMFQGLRLMQAWAKLYRMYFVSVTGQPYSAVVDPLGVALIEPWNHSQIMTISLNLDYIVLHTDGNAAKFPAVRKAYASAVEIVSLDIESAALLFSRHPDKSAKDIAAEFGLEPEAEYLRRSAELRRKKLPGQG